MSKKKDNSNQKGRMKGSANKTDGEAKHLFIQTIGLHSENIDEAFQQLFESDKVKFLEVFAKYASYFAPKKTESTDNLDVAVEGFDISKLYNNQVTNK